MKHEEFSPNVSDFWCVLWERGIEDRNALHSSVRIQAVVNWRVQTSACKKT